MIEGGFKVYYFYKYELIKSLIHSKHHLHGRSIFKALASYTFARFHEFFPVNELIHIVPIDDKPKLSFSHTAVLAKAMSSYCLRPSFHTLHATSSVSYSGKSLKFRQNHKRNYKLLKELKYPVILVDDLITTGSSIKEAKTFLEKKGKRVLFAVVLADARADI